MGLILPETVIFVTRDDQLPEITESNLTDKAVKDNVNMSIHRDSNKFKANLEKVMPFNKTDAFAQKIMEREMARAQKAYEVITKLKYEEKGAAINKEFSKNIMAKLQIAKTAEVKETTLGKITQNIKK